MQLKHPLSLYKNLATNWGAFWPLFFGFLIFFVQIGVKIAPEPTPNRLRCFLEELVIVYGTTFRTFFFIISLNIGRVDSRRARSG